MVKMRLDPNKDKKVMKAMILKSLVLISHLILSAFILLSLMHYFPIISWFFIVFYSSAIVLALDFIDMKVLH